MPNVSVIIPCYNSEKTIRETIESVLAQTYRDFEIIVVDDGSTDGSKDVILSFGTKLTYIYQENKGQSAAQNTGIRFAKGDYLAFVDADDLWLPQKLEKQIHLLNVKGVEWCYCDCFYFRDGYADKIIEKFSRKVYKPHEGWVLRKLLLGNFISSATPLVSKALIMRCGLFDESQDIRIGQDWDHWLRLAANAEVAYVNEPLAMHRLHTESMTFEIDALQAYQYHTNIIEKITALYAQELSPVKKFVLAHYAARFSRSAWLQGNIDEARILVKKACGLEPGNIKYRILSLFYVLPYHLVHAVIQIRNVTRTGLRK